MSKQPKLKTVQSLRTWQKVKAGLVTGAFVCPVAPATVLASIKWSEWYAKTSSSLPFGFAMLIVAVILAIIGVFKSEVVFKKADIALLCLAGWFLVIGLSFMFLANLIYEMGQMWLGVGFGLLASSGYVFAEKKFVEPNVAFYQKLIEENCLDSKSKKRAKREEQARKDAEEDAKRQASE